MQLDPEAPVVVVPVELRGDTGTRFVDMVDVEQILVDSLFRFDGPPLELPLTLGRQRHRRRLGRGQSYSPSPLFSTQLPYTGWPRDFCLRLNWRGQPGLGFPWQTP